MKHIGIVALLLLMTAGAGESTAQTKTDTTKVKSDSITWSKELDGVVIKAQKQLVKQEIDRIGYDVQADEESKTQTVMDMLRKVPMVTVDGQDNILVKGNSSYKIYKNGHYDPSLSKNAKETFKSMPASMVKRIEVITDPGAREDAEGVDADETYGTDVPTDAGEYTVRATVAETDDYADGTATADFTIAKAAATISYETSNESVATVNSETGEVTIIDAGTATIKATVVDGTNYTYAVKTAEYTLTVNTNTGIKTVKAAADKDVWYDINGRKLQQKPIVKGVYMKNGKKVVI